jgi:transcriptional regulator NrdR family protein
MIFCAKEGCDGKTTVVETRGTFRRRRCLACGGRFYTEEVEYELPPGEKSPFTIKWQEYSDKREGYTT